MQQLDNFIVEKLKINKNTKVSNQKILQEKNISAKDGAVIVMDLDYKHIFMMYDQNSGTLSCFGFNTAEEYAKEWSIDIKDAKDLESLKEGETDYDIKTGAIITKIVDE